MTMSEVLSNSNNICDVYQDIKNFGSSVLTFVLWTIGIIVTLIIIYAVYKNVIEPRNKRAKREQMEKAFLERMPAKYNRFSKQQLIDIRNYIQKMREANAKSSYYDKKARTEYTSRDDSINNLIGALAGGMVADQNRDELKKKYNLTIENAALELKYLNSIL